MKFTETLAAVILLVASTVSAAPAPQAPKPKTVGGLPECPKGFFVAFNAPGQGKVSCMPVSQLPRPARRDIKAGPIHYDFEKRQATTPTATPPAATKPKLSPKDHALKRAKFHNATTAEVTFLNSVDDVTYEKMAKNSMALYQATEALWSKTLPQLSSLPTAIIKAPGNHTRMHKQEHIPGQKSSSKSRFIRFAQRQKGVSDDTIAKLQATPDTTFDELRELSMKDRFVKEATMVGLTDLAGWFQDTVPAPLFAELDQLQTKVRNARKDMRALKKPSV
ncbi:hypothetical protein TWF694_004158 [Orbilia ellipsospora]|uniref:Uncharacterized protein n=1 Tax=Orbilia ellipsospora TaxID=2528407 RepID=A0AAV9WYK9_9PEZI